jgi:predicted site-specific integrase-resolvase
MMRELTVKQFARVEQVTERTVRNWILKGAVAVRRTPGGGIRIRTTPSGAPVVILLNSHENEISPNK